jgi:hypothetical protein
MENQNPFLSMSTREFLLYFLSKYPASMKQTEENQIDKQGFSQDPEYVKMRKLYPDGSVSSYKEVDLSLESITYARTIADAVHSEVLDFIVLNVPFLPGWKSKKLMATFFETLTNPFTSLFDLGLYKKCESNSLNMLQTITQANGRQPVVFMLNTIGFSSEEPIYSPSALVMNYTKITHFMNYLCKDGEVEPYSYVSNFEEHENIKKEITKLLYENKKEEAIQLCSKITRENIRKKFIEVIQNGTY